ncbi:hypothetical protein U879_12485 [Defluviimonas sp. 20V17]|nr:hypothetical protein U879_12485 [Defluviimonas sp. 20V17]
MRGERATLGKSLLDVQRELKIKATYVAAIENCDVSAFETPGFVAGYVRSYARYLGMDPEWAYGRFCEEADFSVAHGLSGAVGGKTSTAGGGATGWGAKAANSKPGAKSGTKALPGSLGGFGLGGRGAPKDGAKSVRAAPQAKRMTHRDPLANPNATFVPRSPALLTEFEPRALGSLAVLIALIAGLGYGGWAVLQQVQRVQLAPVDQAPGAVADLDPLANVAAAPDQPQGKTADVTLPSNDQMDRLYRPQALQVPVMVARDGPIAAIKPGSLGALSASADDSAMDLADGASTTSATTSATQTASGQDAVAAAANAAVASLAAGAAVGDGQIKVVADAAPAVQVLAVRPAWVRVRAADGTVLFEKILDAGERYTVPQNAEPATLRAGNSGAVYFILDGKAYGPAAPGAQVIKKLTLTAKNLEDRYKIADLARNPDLAGAVDVAQAQPQKTPGQASQ